MKKILILFPVLLFISCEKESEDAFDVLTLKETILTTHEKPTHASLLAQVESLEESVATLHADLTETNLVAAQDQWKACAEVYSLSEVFNLGEVKTASIHYGIYGWEALTQTINQTISEGISLDEFDMNTMSANARGLGAIEHLLFGQESLHALEDENRRNYLLLLAQNLIEKLTILSNLWEDQRTEFIENPEGNLDGGINQLINQINNLLTEVKKNKIGSPAGLESSGLDTEALQSDFSGTSLKLIKANLQSVYDVYFEGQVSLSQYVASVTEDETLNESLEESFANIFDIISSIDVTLATAITEQPEKVEALHEAISELIILFRADISSTLSITLTATDADGD